MSVFKVLMVFYFWCLKTCHYWGCSMSAYHFWCLKTCHYWWCFMSVYNFWYLQLIKPVTIESVLCQLITSGVCSCYNLSLLKWIIAGLLLELKWVIIPSVLNMKDVWAVKAVRLLLHQFREILFYCLHMSNIILFALIFFFHKKTFRVFHIYIEWHVECRPLSSKTCGFSLKVFVLCFLHSLYLPFWIYLFFYINFT